MKRRPNTFLGEGWDYWIALILYILGTAFLVAATIINFDKLDNISLSLAVLAIAGLFTVVCHEFIL
jgi:hypothetical protein